MRKISIKAARVDAELTQDDMSNALGMTRANYSHIESGKISIRPAYVMAIAQLTGFKVEELRLPNEPREEANG